MKRNPRQARFRKELKRLLRRGVPAAKAMRQAWKRVPKNPRRRFFTAGQEQKHRRAQAPPSSWMRAYMERRARARARRKGNPLTRRKARKILHEGRAKGRPLTPAQRRLFGAVASGYKLRDYPTLNPPPVKLYANGRLVGLIGFRPTRGRKVGRNPRIDIRI